MPRPKRCRRVLAEPTSRYFKPAGIRLRGLAEVRLSLDELEALRLADLQGLYHAVAAERMGVSRQTFGRLVAEARSKVARALVQAKAIRIEGGPVQLDRASQEGTTMRVALALDADRELSSHFGRSAQFIVCRLEGGKRVGEEARDNPHKGGPHGRQHGCGHGHGTGHGAGHGAGHRWVTDTLGDCDAVITAGIGGGATAALRSAGIRPVVVEERISPDKALELFAEGKL